MIGALVQGMGTRFRVWAEKPRSLALEIIHPSPARVELAPEGGGYYGAFVDGVAAGARYFYLVDGERRRPDPASRAQPEGVHGPSEVVDPAAFAWQHSRRPRAVGELVIYELHVGTFTPGGTFDSAVGALDRLVDLGVTAVEIMPVASFSGTRNWGYDGVGWFAPQASYGGPDGLRRLVDACHERGLTVLLDVVYNHLGPEGNYLHDFANYFTARHHTPWGDALDYDGEHAAQVRGHVLANVCMWLEEYRVDGFRLDAVQTIVDDSPRHIVAEIAAFAHAHGALCIAESDLGEVKVIDERGWGCDAQWSDDFHHALHAVVTGERTHYYQDFGAVAQLATAITDGFVYTGQQSRYRGRPFGTPSRGLPGERFVIAAQNHDQVGNRAFGERLSQLQPDCVWAVAATYLLAPAVPLIFMGEEHADPAPFLYFTDHQDPALARAVSEGRRREFPAWAAAELPDPQALDTFARSRIDWALADSGRHAGVRRFYRELLRLRRERPALRKLDKQRTRTGVDEEQGGLWVLREGDGEETLLVVSLRTRPVELRTPAPARGRWTVLLDAGGAQFSGPEGAALAGDRVTLPPFGALVLTSD
jgi:maltooligosyltrehalose trehalohydrolase